MTRFNNNLMLAALFAEGPLPAQAEQMRLYEPFIGSWNVEVIDYDAEGVAIKNHGEWYFGWILEGRAIQDVWIVPPRQLRPNEATDISHNRYGTTLRVYNPTIEAWNITWINPVTQAYDRMIGRKVDDNIVQEYTGEDGTLNQWIFFEITADAFHWIGKSSVDDGKSWRTEAEFYAERQKTNC